MVPQGISHLEDVYRTHNSWGCALCNIYHKGCTSGLESPFLLQGTCWFINSYIRAGKKGLKLFIVNVDLKIKEESWHPNKAPPILLICGIRQIIKSSSKKGDNQLCLDKLTTTPKYLQGKKRSKLPPQKLFLIFHHFISNRIKACCFIYFGNTFKYSTLQPDFHFLQINYITASLVSRMWHVSICSQDSIAFLHKFLDK